MIKRKAKTSKERAAERKDKREKQREYRAKKREESKAKRRAALAVPPHRRMSEKRRIALGVAAWMRSQCAICGKEKCGHPRF